MIFSLFLTKIIIFVKEIELKLIEGKKILGFFIGILFFLIEIYKDEIRFVI